MIAILHSPRHRPTSKNAVVITQKTVADAVAGTA
jgi:hypothetical protein